MTTELDLEIAELTEQGFCCSQIMIIKALQLKGEDNPSLIKAAGGLCGGLRSGLVCGALSGADCLISLLSEAENRDDLMVRLNNWFLDTFGAYDCNKLTDMKNPEKKAEVCPVIKRETYKKAVELLEL
ncbi:MAG: C-GCAxxG-C-C family protein [Spirochaetales bacterium]|nr:C-GCAxxG-C-C family protein [Spirochaetales bacterium]